MMSDQIHPVSEITDETLEGMLRRALRITLILGALAALAIWKASGWRNAAMMAAGAAISAASIHEWRRLVRLISAAFARNQVPRGALLGISLFLLRLGVFAAAIYVSLKFVQGSVVALLCGLGLALAAMVWEALRLLRE
jgi:hypothetical protein